MPNVQRCIAATIDKIETLTNEDKLANFVRKKMHSAINERTQQVINQLVEQLQQYSETLHQQVAARSDNLQSVCPQWRRDGSSSWFTQVLLEERPLNGCLSGSS